MDAPIPLFAVCRAKGFNRLANLATDPITPLPLPLPAAPAAVAAVHFPPNFPVTRGDLLHLNSADLNTIALLYGPPLGATGTVVQRRNRLAEYIGMRVPVL
jgi:hypothetical protein